MDILKNMEEVFYRLKLNNRKFFKDVNFNGNKKLKNAIVSWYITLNKRKGITINSFSSLLKEYGEISFPVSIKGVNLRGSINLRIEDSNHRQYYMEIYKGYYEKMTVYDIGERTSKFDTTCEYEIQKETNVLKKKYIIPLEKDGTNKDFSITFEYGKEITATLKTAFYKVIVSYDKKYDKIEKDMCEYLLSLSTEEQINNVFEKFLIIFIMFFEENDSLSVKVISQKDILSKVVMEKGIVTSYSYTKKDSEFKTWYYSIIPMERMADFIIKYAPEENRCLN